MSVKAVAPKRHGKPTSCQTCLWPSGSFLCVKSFVISRVSFYREVRFIAARFVISRDSFCYKGALVISRGILYQFVNVMHFDLQEVQTANSDQKICNDRQKI